MSNFKRYTMVIRRDENGFAIPALKIRKEGEVLKFDEVKEFLQTSNLQLLLNKYLDTSPGLSKSNRECLQVFVLWSQQQHTTT